MNFQKSWFDIIHLSILKTGKAKAYALAPLKPFVKCWNAAADILEYKKNSKDEV